MNNINLYDWSISKNFKGETRNNEDEGEAEEEEEEAGEEKEEEEAEGLTLRSQEHQDEWKDLLWHPEKTAIR